MSQATSQLGYCLTTKTPEGSTQKSQSPSVEQRDAVDALRVDEERGSVVGEKVEMGGRWDLILSKCLS